MNWQHIRQVIAPQNLTDIVFASDYQQQQVLNIASGAKPFPFSGVNGILLYGIPGTGKSALAELLPQAMAISRGDEEAYEQFRRIETGKDGADMIKNINARAQLMPAATHHYFVLDEVDHLTTAGMKSLKSAMNMPNTIFILTTNHFSKVEWGVRSRCHKFAFNAAPPDRWLPVAHKLLQLTEVTGVSDAQLISVITTCQGDGRLIVDALVTLVVAWRAQQGLPVIPP